MDPVIEALEHIEETGSFCVETALPKNTLKLSVNRVGEINFPVSKDQAKALIKRASPAKFGWKDQTLLDKHVRNAWEILPENMLIQASWNDTLKEALERLSIRLGLPESSYLTAELHNLLIYEPGQFFDYHQDSEKQSGMVASLVIVLPSQHEGGALVIDHQGEKKTFKSSEFSLKQLTGIAFYADCHHAIEPVTKGYRLALTYNLMLHAEAEKSSAKQEVNKPYPALSLALKQHFSESHAESDYRSDKPQKYVSLLDHSYTQKGLSWEHLKNVDHLRAEALKQVAQQLDLDVYLTLVDVHEIWTCESDYEDDYYFYDEEEGDEEEEGHHDDRYDDAELGELVDEDITFYHWLDREGRTVDYKDIHVPMRSVGYTKASQEFKPFESQYEGYMGNYGNTMDRWYHRAAIVLWRKKDHYAVMFAMDQDSMLQELSERMKKSDQLEAIRKIMRSLLPYWADKIQYKQDKTDFMNQVFYCAAYVNDPGLAKGIVTGFNMDVLTPQRVKLLSALQELYGAEWCLGVFQAWTHKTDHRSNVGKCAPIDGIVEALVCESSDYQPLTHWLLNYQWNEVQHSVVSKKDNDRWGPAPKAYSEQLKDIRELLRACIVGNEKPFYSGILKYLMDQTNHYDSVGLAMVVEDIAALLSKQKSAEWSYQSLLDYVIYQLTEEKNRGLRSEQDWSISTRTGCACADCLTLQVFLGDAHAQQSIFPMAQNRRQHLQDKVRGMPIKAETINKGSPHKLVLTKTDQLYKQAKYRFETVLETLDRLSTLVR